MRATCGLLDDPIPGLLNGLRDSDLRPGPRVNALFDRLLSIASSCAEEHPSARDPRVVAESRALCAVGEGHLEVAWARRVIDDPAGLAAFPYLRHYRDLATAEHGAITQAAHGRPVHVVFAGCGPLPLTALVLREIEPGWRISCIDRDPEAVALARRVVRALAGTGRGITVEPGEATAHDYSGADVVILAALVGSTAQEKRDLLVHLGRTLGPDTLLAARSVPDDGRRLLYARIDPATAGDTLDVLQEHPPPPGVINSLLLMRPRPSGGQPAPVT